MVGVEGMTGASLQIGIGIVLIIAGIACAYAAFFWESAKNILSDNAQKALGTFAQHRVIRFGMLALALETLILSRFIEQHRWPFSYPADPSVLADNAQLHSQIDNVTSAFGKEKELADKWRFASELWRNSQTNAGPPECKYQIQYTPRFANVVPTFWRDMLQSAGWHAESFVQNDGGTHTNRNNDPLQQRCYRLGSRQQLSATKFPMCKRIAKSY
jgi:hypothetical protein